MTFSRMKTFLFYVHLSIKNRLQEGDGLKDDNYASSTRATGVRDGMLPQSCVMCLSTPLTAVRDEEPRGTQWI